MSRSTFQPLLDEQTPDDFQEESSLISKSQQPHKSKSSIVQRFQMWKDKKSASAPELLMKPGRVALDEREETHAPVKLKESPGSGRGYKKY